jgi:hypothetical protein
MADWLPVSSTAGPLQVGASFTWQAVAPFVVPVRTTGRVRRLEPRRVLELELDMRFSTVPSTLTVELAGSPGAGRTSVGIRHENLPDGDLGLFETNGYAHCGRTTDHREPVRGASAVAALRTRIRSVVDAGWWISRRAGRTTTR